MTERFFGMTCKYKHDLIIPIWAFRIVFKNIEVVNVKAWGSPSRLSHTRFHLQFTIISEPSCLSLGTAIIFSSLLIFYCYVIPVARLEACLWNVWIIMFQIWEVHVSSDHLILTSMREESICVCEMWLTFLFCYNNCLSLWSSWSARRRLRLKSK